MITFTLHQAAELTGGLVHGDDVVFEGCSTDSRTLEAGQLFVALRGENFDGHDFLARAFERGASAALVDSRVGEVAGKRYLQVTDTLTAFGALAATWRQRFELPLIAITGSNGKTTVKEMVASILGQAAPVLATRGNLNNEIGVPATLCRLGTEHRSAVVEMGANHPGEIDRLARMAAPTVGVVTLCAPAHLEGFGSVAGVAHAKGEIYAALSPHATAVINADDEYAPAWVQRAAGRRTIRFGLEVEAEVCASWSGDAAGSDIELKVAGQCANLRLPLAGRHNVMNALAAAAATYAAGWSLEQIVAGLTATSAVPGRLQPRRASSGAQILDDSYNANPSSAVAALAVLGGLPGRRWVALGDMAELGSAAHEGHVEVGRIARESGVERLMAVGPLGVATVEAFGARGHHFESKDALIEHLRAKLPADVTLLVKGSRSAGMEAVVEALCERREVSCC